MGSTPGCVRQGQAARSPTDRDRRDGPLGPATVELHRDPPPGEQAARPAIAPAERGRQALQASCPPSVVLPSLPVETVRRHGFATITPTSMPLGVARPDGCTGSPTVDLRVRPERPLMLLPPVLTQNFHGCQSRVDAAPGCAPHRSQQGGPMYEWTRPGPRQPQWLGY